MKRSFQLLFLQLVFFFFYTKEIKAQFWGAKQARPFSTPSDSLRQGEFTWNPELSTTGPLVVVVSLDEQRAYTYRNGLLIGVATTSSGKKGFESPTGVFHTIMKDAKHRSSKYNNAPMPYTQKITQSGVALHAGGLPGYPSSHGCIHLPSEYARLLFNISKLGMTVVISKKTKFPEFINHPNFLSPIDEIGNQQPHERLSDNENFRWNPEKSTDGPLSMIISRSDKRIIVTRNGIEIGRSKVQIRNVNDSIGTNVYVAHNKSPVPLTGVNSLSQKFQWLVHPVVQPKHGYNDLNQDLEPLERITIPDNFIKQLATSITDGTTVVITDAPILANTTGKKLAVLSSFSSE